MLADGSVDIDALAAESDSLARELRERCAKLEAQLADAERDAPARLERAREQAQTALRRLESLDAQRRQIERGVAEKAVSSAGLSERLGPPGARLRHLRHAQLVLATLLHASELCARALRKIAEAGGQAGGGERAGTTAALGSLMRLHALRTTVASGAAVGVAADGASPDASAGIDASDGEVLRALQAMVEAQLALALPPLKERMVARLAAALKALGWPAEVSLAPDAEGKLDEMRGAIAELLLLQHCAEGGAGDVATAAGGEAGGARPPGADSKRLWALEPLLDPVLVRFRYHFEGRRETNRRDKPEWVYSHCTMLLRLHAGEGPSQQHPCVTSRVMRGPPPHVAMATRCRVSHTTRPADAARAARDDRRRLARHVDGARGGRARPRGRERVSPRGRRGEGARAVCEARVRALPAWGVRRSMRRGVNIPRRRSSPVGASRPLTRATPASAGVWCSARQARPGDGRAAQAARALLPHAHRDHRMGGRAKTFAPATSRRLRRAAGLLQYGGADGGMA